MEDTGATPTPCPICGPVAPSYGLVCPPCRATPRHLPNAARVRIIHHLNQILRICDLTMLFWSDQMDEIEEEETENTAELGSLQGIRNFEAERQAADLRQAAVFMDSIALTKSILRTTWVFSLGVYAPGPYGSLFFNRRVAMYTLYDIYARCASE